MTTSMAFTLPDTVISSLDGSLAIEITEYEGIHRLPNRDAVGAYFSYKAEEGGEVNRIGVIFSGTVTGGLGPLDVPDYNDPEANLVQMALAAIGDALGSKGLPPATPSGVPAHHIDCFSEQISEWRNRKRASEGDIESYLEGRLFCSWKFGHSETFFTSHDLLRLHVSLKSLLRLSKLGEGVRWQTRGAPPMGLILEPTQALLVERRTSKRGRSGIDPEANPPTAPSFVDERRLKELQEVTSTAFDLRKLIRLCEEANTCYAVGSYFAVAMLVRAILDHVPPLFGQTTFQAVANNYPGSKSFKASMDHLDRSARKISDAHLHEQIRPSESLPTRVQVDCASDVDVLLGEVVRLLGSKGS